jgi:hypothetical protein
MVASVTVIKVMADYDTFPLWRSGEGGVVNIDPADLPITQALVQALTQWAQAYDATLDREYPPDSKFPSAAAEAEFHAAGERLARQLSKQLGVWCLVEYVDGRPASTPSSETTGTPHPGRDNPERHNPERHNPERDDPGRDNLARVRAAEAGAEPC